MRDKISMTGKYLGILCFTISTHVHAAANPASTDYVDRAVQNAAYTAGTGISISSSRVISQTPTYSVGDIAQGGVVMYVDATGRHGLVLGLTSFESVPYYTDNTVAVSGIANGVGAGAVNTAAILGTAQALNTTVPTSGYAAWYAALVSATNDGTLCDSTNYTNPQSSVCFSFYLPSVAELQLIANNNGTNNYDVINAALSRAPGGIPLSTSEQYWTSTTDRNIGTSPPFQAYVVTNISTGVAAVAETTTQHTARPVRQF